MFVIGERINGMFKDVNKAIRERDKSVIQDLARRQEDAGANALDVNVGVSDNPIDSMEWLVNAVGEVSKLSLAIDTTKPDVMEKGLQTSKSPTIINSISGDKVKLDIYIPMARKYNAGIIALTTNEKGIPQNADMRTEIAATIVSRYQEAGMDLNSLYIDSVILPVNVAQDNAKEVLEAIKQCKIISDPPPKTILGLSNVSQKCLNRSLVNRVFLAMAISCGLDAAILDPTDKELMDTMITGELLMNKFIYCDDYLEAYHKK